MQIVKESKFKPLTYHRSIKMNLKYITSIKKIIGYMGWIGYGNLGDEAIYMATKKMLHNYNVLPFKYSRKIQIFQKIKGGRLFCATILGGGTLINSKAYLEEFKLAQDKYTSSFILGTGVRNPAFWDRIEPEKKCLGEWIECLKKSNYVGVRGPLSKRILNENGFYEAEIMGDPALFLAKDRVRNKKKEKRLGINIGISRGRVWGSEESVLNFIVEFSKIMINDGWQIMFLPVRKEDIAYIEEAAKRIDKSVSIFYEYNSIKKTMDFLENCDLFVGEKLHSVILAMCTYTPSIMFEYRPKCLDFMMSMNLEKFNIRTDKLELDLVISLLKELYENLEYFQKRIFQKVSYYKQLQEEKINIISEAILKQ